MMHTRLLHLASELKRLRRHLHRHPELSHHEYNTASFIAATLRTQGIDAIFRPIQTSVCCLLGSLPVALAIRADIDAVPVTERTSLPFASVAPGVMHACGHDAHAAILLGLACHLHTLRPRRGILLLFQHAEEAHPSGAPELAKHVPVDCLPPEVLGFHLVPDIQAGIIGIREGHLMASLTGITIELAPSIPSLPVQGVGAARPFDALGAALSLYRDTASLRVDLDTEDPDVPSLTIGKAHIGAKPNAIAQTASLEASLRSFTEDARKRTITSLRGILRRICRQASGRYRMRVCEGIRP